MSLPLPSSLSPSKLTTFRECPLAFRFSAIDKLPEPPSAPALKGTLVHEVLERLFWDVPAGLRTAKRANAIFDEIIPVFQQREDVLLLRLEETDAQAFVRDARRLVQNYFLLEDPNNVNVIGIELMVATPTVNPMLRGIIDRLDIDANEDLIVVDYKTGRAPGKNFEDHKLTGVNFYAYLCEQLLGRLPKSVHLLYLREPIRISREMTPQHTRGTRAQTNAAWQAITRACEKDDFRPKPNRLCDWCAFIAYCPAKGGDLSLVEAIKQQQKVSK